MKNKKQKLSATQKLEDEEDYVTHKLLKNHLAEDLTIHFIVDE